MHPIIPLLVCGGALTFGAAVGWGAAYKFFVTKKEASLEKQSILMPPNQAYA